MENLEERLLRNLRRASRDWSLLEPDDRIMVCMSGGKDSYALLQLLRRMQSVVPFRFELVAVNLDQGHPGYPQHVLRDWLEREGYEHRMLSVDTYSIVLEKVPEGKTYCSMCSRLRRGILYNAAVELGCTKLALGHHRDDLVETALLNLFYGGKLGTMPPRLRSDDGRNVVIRPLVYCSEDDVAAYAAEQQFPILPCNLCGSQDGLHRQRIKALLAGLEAENPRVKGNMLAALGNIQPSHLLDRDLLAKLAMAEGAGVDPWIGEAG
jgi:tRNA 2-thiocytidine biosynthesis protein TtcA